VYTNIGERAYFFLRSSSELQTITDTTSFKKKLKEHFYNHFFDFSTDDITT